MAFSKQILLRLGIILFGLRLTFQDIGQVGVVGVMIDLIVLSSTFTLSCWAGTRLFGLNRRTAMLIGAGSSICGAAAVMATEPVVRGRAEEVCVAVSTVVAFGTLAIFIYPALYHLNDRLHWISITPFAYGIFTGSTVHEVAQVVAAGKAVADTAANTAVITKLVRVMMLAPFLVLLSAYLARNVEAGAAPRRGPWAINSHPVLARRHTLVRTGVHRGGGIQLHGYIAASFGECRHRRRYADSRDRNGRVGGQYAVFGHTCSRGQAARVGGAAVRLADIRRLCDQYRRIGAIRAGTGTLTCARSATRSRATGFKRRRAVMKAVACIEN